VTLFVDAHVLLWAIYTRDRLSQRAREILEDMDNVLLVSEATQWELLNKVGRGKIPFTGSSVPAVAQRIRDLQVEFVSILQQDTIVAATLSHHHSDPFDRMLIAQSLRLSCPVLTKDRVFASYDIPTVW
jgi:PIN domain nuclease of toxin-antitoxin system